MDNELDNRLRDHCFKLFLEEGVDRGEVYTPGMRVDLALAFNTGWRWGKEIEGIIPRSLGNADIKHAVDAAIADGAGEEGI